MKRILLIFTLLISIISFSFAQANAVDTKKISLEDIWTYYKFYPRTVKSFNSMNDGNFYTILIKGNIKKYAFKNGKLVTTILSADNLTALNGGKKFAYSNYEFSADESKILLITNTVKIYRHSFTAEYYVYDIAAKTLSKVSDNGPQQLATFSPKADKVAFVRKNNIYIKDITTGKEKAITTDGKMNSIINGACDWVYEEEFAFTDAFKWSPEGDYIAYLKFDESKVKEYELEFFGNLYPDIYKYKYPKAGEDNSVLSVHTYSLADGKTNTMDIGENTDIYIPRIDWTTKNNELSIQRLNRLQNHWEILLADASTGKTSVLYSEKNEYYIDITDNLIFLKDGKSFIFTSEKDGFNHVYQYGMDGKEIKQLTKGKYDVESLLGVDQKKGKLYIKAAYSSPLNREIFEVSMKNGKMKQLSTKDGFNDAVFSSNFKYFTNTNTTANTPHYTSMNDTKGKELYTLEDNSSFISRMKEYGFSEMNFFKIKTDNDIELNASMIKPKDFDPSKKYPVLMFVYGGPGSQTVKNSWGWFNYVWFQMLAQKGYIIVSVDNRGTGFRGEEFKKMTYQQLGKYEVEDQINAAKYLATQDYIDGSRIGIFGWSYGGYMSTLCMTKGADYFKAGIAVAPVTNWRYYDNIYTERFMRTPQENANGYDDNSPISHVSKLKGKYLLVHGITDDNVHVQNSMDLVTALVTENKEFDMQFYPNNDHSIFHGKNVRLHLYNKMTKFILDNL
ncbi:MAG: S9 family peptidase [Bacteroidetes bacterium 4572_112]|nr:MAG: S9 family peptidase [Bacteroidetes bacterium 4572_112]